MSTGENVTSENQTPFCDVIFDRFSFVTGSYAYGMPTEESDIDLVVLLSEREIAQLKTMADSYINNDKKYGGGNDSLMFGKLNLICLSKEEDFKAWREVTNELIKSGREYSKAESSRIFHERLDIGQ